MLERWLGADALFLRRDRAKPVVVRLVERLSGIM
jgi:hypothetical protein